MKKVLVSGMVLALLAGCAIAATTPTTLPAPLPREEKGYVSVNINEYKDLTPDTAQLSVVIETCDNKSMQQATAANKELSDSVYAALKSMINPANGDFVGTADFSAVPEYKTGMNNRRILDRYVVRNSVTVRTKSIGSVGAMIDKSIELGAKNVGNLSFSVSKYDQECDALLGIASQKAYHQALATLKPSGASIAGIKYMNASCSGASSRAPMRMVMKASYESMDSASGVYENTVIEAGVLRINANLNAAYYIK